MKRTMKSLSLLLTALALFSGLRTQAADQSVAAEKGGEPLRIDAPELAKLNFDLSTGGLPVAPGLETCLLYTSPSPRD